MSVGRKKKSEPHRAGFVALIGRPNVGKSTLVNAMVGQKVSIVSPKPQTTRTRIQAILTRPAHQIVLVDTPGFTDATNALRRVMRRAAGEAAIDADVALVVTEVHGDRPEVSPKDLEILAEARKGTGKIVVAVNKVDRLARKELLLPWIDAHQRETGLTTFVPISATKREGLAELEAEIAKLLPESPQLFPEDMVTDQAERVLAAELVREQLLLRTREEVPHAAAVVIERFEDLRGDDGKGLVRLEGRIYVERESQKAIVVGKGGAQIKAVSTAARQSIERVLGCKVYLRLTVHVDPDWTSTDKGVSRRLGDVGFST